MPELGAVEPATPIAMPLRVRMRASSPRAAVLARGDDLPEPPESASAPALTQGDDPMGSHGSASAAVLTGGDDPPEPPRSGSAAVPVPTLVITLDPGSASCPPARLAASASRRAPCRLLSLATAWS